MVWLPLLFGTVAGGGLVYGFNKKETHEAAEDLIEKFKDAPLEASGDALGKAWEGTKYVATAPVRGGEAVRDMYDGVTNPTKKIEEALADVKEDGGSGVFNMLAGVAPWALGGKALGLTGFLGNSLQSGAASTGLTLLVVASAAAWIYQNYGDEIKSMIGMDGDDASPNNGGATSTATDTDELTLTGVEPSPM